VKSPVNTLLINRYTNDTVKIAAIWVYPLRKCARTIFLLLTGRENRVSRLLFDFNCAYSRIGIHVARIPIKLVVTVSPEL
jgi:hypothetical protein